MAGQGRRWEWRDLHDGLGSLLAGLCLLLGIARQLVRQILDLLAAGRSNGQIARQLSLSPKTVANYTSTIFAKLQVSDRAEAVIRAREAGLGKG